MITRYQAKLFEQTTTIMKQFHITFFRFGGMRTKFDSFFPPRLAVMTGGGWLVTCLKSVIIFNM